MAPFERSTIVVRCAFFHCVRSLRPLPAVSPVHWPEFKALMRLALPLAAAQAGQALMGLVDTAVMGRVSAQAQAAAGLGNSLTFTITFLGMGVMLALDPLVSQSVGAKDFATARRWYRHGVVLAVLVGVVLMVPVALVPLTLPRFGVEPSLAHAAHGYALWRLPGVVGVLLFVGARAYLQGLGITKPIFWAMAVANVFNLGLDIVLVFGLGPLPALGAAGAAIATTICTFAQLAMLLPAIARRHRDGGGEPIEASLLRQVLLLGLPIGFHMLAEAGVFATAGILAAGFGEAASAAHQAALSWGSLTFCVAVGVGSAAATRVGWAIGAKDSIGARRAGATAFLTATGFMGLTSLGFVLAPALFAGVMTDVPAVLPIARSLMFIVAAFQISDGLQAVGAGALRGAGDTRFTFYANVIGHWGVGLPVAWAFGVSMGLGVQGVWWGLCAGLTAVGAALVVRFFWLPA
jgi:multidrug resistance protein, MATE family